MDIATITRLTSNKSTGLSIKINPELLALVDQVIEHDKLSSRQHFFDNAVLTYLEQKGVLK